MVKLDLKPKVVYFIRHINDFSYTEELLASVTESELIFYGPASLGREISNRAQRVGVTLYTVSRRYDLFFIMLDKLLNSIVSRFLKTKLFTCAENLEQPILSHVITKRIKKLISSKREITEFVNCYAFDHTINPLTIKIIKLLRGISMGVPIISLPHGAYIFENKMLDIYELTPREKQNYKIYDYVVCNDGGHEKIINGNNIIIPNLKYTSEKFMDADEKNKEKTKNPKILILHTKFVGNIFENEFKRCVRILSKFNELDVLIRPHPRGMKEVKRIVGVGVKYSEINVPIEDDIRSADVVIMFGTSAVFDAFLMRKPVLFPKYATSNQISAEILNECIIANTADEFYSLIKDISKGVPLKIPKWKFPRREELEIKWRKFLFSPNEVLNKNKVQAFSSNSLN